MTSNFCDICNDTGFVNGKVCKCVINKLIDANMPLRLKSVKVPDQFKKMQIDQQVYDSSLYFGGNLLFSSDGKSNISYKQFLKLYVTHFIIKHKTATINYLSGKEIFDIFISDDVNLQQDVLKYDLLIISFGNDFKNQYLQDIMPHIIGNRISQSLQTIVVWENPLVKDSSSKKEYIQDKYGVLTYNYLITSFVIADKKLTFDNKKFFIKDKEK